MGEEVDSPAALMDRVMGELETEARAIQGTFDDVFPEYDAGSTVAPGKEYTGAIFFAQQPEKCKRVVFLLATNSMGVNDIAKAVGCANRTVMLIRDKFREKVATVRQRLASMAEHAKLQLLERLIANPDAVPVKDIPAALEKLTNVAMADRGTAPPPQQHLHAHVSAEQYAELLRQARGMGLEGGENAGIGRAIEAPAMPVGGDVSRPREDAESLARQSKIERDATSETTGEGGVRAADGGGGYADVLPGSQNSQP